MKSARFSFVGALLFSLAFVSASQAGYLFSHIPSGGPDPDFGLWQSSTVTGSISNAFSVNTPVKVTDLLDSGPGFDGNTSFGAYGPSNFTATITETIQLIRLSDNAVLGAVTSPTYTPGQSTTPLSGSITPVVLQTGVNYAIVTTFTIVPDGMTFVQWEYRPVVGGIVADSAVVSAPSTLYEANAIITAVPEPATLGLMGAGLIAVATRRRR